MTEKKSSKKFDFDKNPPEDRISYQELGLIAMMLAMFAVAAYFFVRFLRLYEETGFQGAEVTSEWGGLVLLLILTQIAAMILTQIGLAILHTIITREEPPEIEDERDKLIELQGSHHSSNATGIFFIIAMLALWRGQEPMLALNIVVFGMLFSSVVNFSAQLFYRRRGF
jgi:hypothetical protein